MVIGPIRPLAPHPSRQPLTFDDIDRPVEAVLTPLVDPSMLSIISNFSGGQSYHMQGRIVNGGQQVPYDFTVQTAGSQTDPSGSIQGTLAGLPVQVELGTSGFTFYERGHIGANDVHLDNSYNIFTGDITTRGHIGRVDADLHLNASFPLNVDGQLGGADTHLVMNRANGTVTVNGNVGSDRIGGRVDPVDGRTQKLQMHVGDIQVAETASRTRA